MTGKKNVIGRFLVERKIDTGGMSEIFEVKDNSLNARWAMKSVSLSDSCGLKAARTEVEILKSVSHPSIPRIADMCEEDERLYIFMDYIEGVNLKTMAESVGGLKEKDAVKIGIKLALVLSYLHSKGIVYRDLKPSNVMITKEGYVRLTDFGIAAKKGSDKKSDIFYATKEYAPPEILAGEIGDERSDVYELGATLAAVCVKKKSKGFKVFCKKCMKKKQKDRFGNASEAALFLKNIDNYNKEAKKNMLASFLWIGLSIICFLMFLLLFQMKTEAEEVLKLPLPETVCENVGVYSGDFDFSADTSFYENMEELKVYAEGGEVTKIYEGLYRISGEGNIRICAVILFRGDDGELKEESYSERVIIDKSSPIISVAFSDRYNDDGSLSFRSMNFSFSDLCVDYQSLCVMINNERVDFEIPTPGTVDFTLDFEGVGSFFGYISVRDKLGHESVANIEPFELGSGFSFEEEENKKEQIIPENEAVEKQTANTNEEKDNECDSKKEEGVKSDFTGETDNKKHQKEETFEKKIKENESKPETEEMIEVVALKNYDDSFFLKMRPYLGKILLLFSIMSFSFGAARLAKECKK